MKRKFNHNASLIKELYGSEFKLDSLLSEQQQNAKGTPYELPKEEKEEKERFFKKNIKRIRNALKRGKSDKSQKLATLSNKELEQELNKVTYDVQPGELNIDTVTQAVDGLLPGDTKLIYKTGGGGYEYSRNPVTGEIAIVKSPKRSSTSKDNPQVIKTNTTKGKNAYNAISKNVFGIDKGEFTPYQEPASNNSSNTEEPVPPEVGESGEESQSGTQTPEDISWTENKWNSVDEAKRNINDLHMDHKDVYDGWGDYTMGLIDVDIGKALKRQHGCPGLHVGFVMTKANFVTKRSTANFEDLTGNDPYDTIDDIADLDDEGINIYSPDGETDIDVAATGRGTDLYYDEGAKMLLADTAMGDYVLKNVHLTSDKTYLYWDPNIIESRFSSGRMLRLSGLINEGTINEIDLVPDAVKAGLFVKDNIADIQKLLGYNKKEDYWVASDLGQVKTIIGNIAAKYESIDDLKNKLDAAMNSIDNVLTVALPFMSDEIFTPPPVVFKNITVAVAEKLGQEYANKLKTAIGKLLQKIVDKKGKSSLAKTVNSDYGGDASQMLAESKSRGQLYRERYFGRY